MAALPLTTKGLAGTGSAIAEALKGFFSRDPVDSMQEYNFGGRDYLPGFGGYPAARPPNEIDPYTETYRSAILPRKPEDVTDYVYGQHGKMRENLTNYGQGPFARLERELLTEDKPHPYQGFMTNALITNYGDSGRKNIETFAPRIDYLPDGTMKLSGGVKQVIPGSAAQFDLEPDLNIPKTLGASRAQPYELPATWEEQGRGAAFPVVGGLTQQENNKLLDPYIRTNLLKQKFMNPGGGYDPDVRALTGWNTDEMNAAVHAAGRTDYGRSWGGNQLYPGIPISPSIRGLTSLYTDIIDKPKNNILAEWQPEVAAVPQLGYARIPGRTKGVGKDVQHPDNIYDMWADEYSKELYDTGITDLQGMIDKGIARPEDFSVGRNLPNESSELSDIAEIAPNLLFQESRYSPVMEDMLPSGPESLNSYNLNTSPANFLTPVSTGSGMQGFIEETPEGIVQTDLETRDVMPWGSGEQYMRAQGFEPVTPDYANLPVEDQTVFDSTTRGPIGDYLRAQEQEFMLPSGPEEMAEVFTQEDKATDWRSILGIESNTGYTPREILGIRESNQRAPNQRAPARRFNRDESGNVRSLARFTEPEVDTDDFIINNLIEAISPAVSRPTSQPGPGGPAKPQPEQDDSSNERQAREAEEAAAAAAAVVVQPKPRKKPKPKKKPKKKKIDPVVSAIQEEIFQQRNTDLLNFLAEGYSRSGRAVLPPSHMLYDI